MIPTPELPNAPAELWSRLPTETLDAFHAFSTYLELGPDQPLHELAQKLNRTHDSIRHLSWRHNWMDRAAAYRQHLSQSLLAATQRQRAKQTELCQLRDEIFRQELWEQRQLIRSLIRKGLNDLVADPQAKLAGYELARLMDIDYKAGNRATAPTGFASEGPAPASPEFKEAMEKAYGQPMSLEEKFNLLLIAHPEQESMIKDLYAKAQAQAQAQAAAAAAPDPSPAPATNDPAPAQPDPAAIINTVAPATPASN